MTDAIAAQPGWYLLAECDGRFRRVPIVGWRLTPNPEPITLWACGNGIEVFYLQPDGIVIEPGGDRSWGCEGQWRTAMLKARGISIPPVPRPPTHSVMP